MCIGGRNDLDAASAEMLAHLLEHHGFSAQVLSGIAATSANLGADSKVKLVCLSYVNPEAMHHARRSIRSIRRTLPPSVPVLLGLWNGYTAGEQLRDARDKTGADDVATSLGGAMKYAQDSVRSESAVVMPSTAA